MNDQIKVSIASDHAGFDLKSEIIKYLKDNEIEVIDRGPSKKEPVDYPDYASKVTQDIINQNAQKGVLVCGTGQGMAMAANKKPGIRAALCYSDEVAKLAREHNDANILTLGARVINQPTALNVVNIFLNTNFEGSRHTERAVSYTHLTLPTIYSV